MENFYGVCAFCGQVISTDLTFGSQEEADIWATENCNCDMARIARRKRESLAQAINQVDLLYGEGCEQYGFKPLEPEALEILKTFTRSVAYGEATKISAVLSGRAGTFKASLTLKGKIKVSRSISNAQVLETE